MNVKNKFCRYQFNRKIFIKKNYFERLFYKIKTLYKKILLPENVIQKITLKQTIVKIM